MFIPESETIVSRDVNTMRTKYPAASVFPLLLLIILPLQPQCIETILNGTLICSVNILNQVFWFCNWDKVMTITQSKRSSGVQPGSERKAMICEGLATAGRRHRSFQVASSVDPLTSR